jgi:hypothetical protein
VVSAPYTQLLHDEVKSYVYLVREGCRGGACDSFYCVSRGFVLIFVLFFLKV